MGKALYRKYRPRSFDEVAGQEPITTTLKNTLKQGNISHAYLFTGPRGTGKTSVARILAHAVNELAYEDESMHLDIIEIDAASNRRIDEIRELRERVHTAPSTGKYKVYIIDEVHMLTREAFNALLKTLEEPPEHAIFVLATTEAHKLPETIISRTQRFNFRPVETAMVINHLKAIAKSEKISIEDAALDLIAVHGGGSFRDSIGLLDQLRGISGQITKQDVQSLLGIPPSEVTEEILAALAAGDRKQLLFNLEKLREQGFLATQVSKHLALKLRNNLVHGNHILEPRAASDLLKQLLEVPTSHDPESLLEIILLSMPFADVPLAPTAPPAAPPTEAREAAPAIPPEEPTPRKNIEGVTPSPSGKPKPKVRSAVNEALWKDALQNLKEKYNTLYSIARIAAPRFEKDNLVLVVGFPFHQKRLNESRNKQIIADIVSELSGDSIVISCELDPKYRPTNFYDPKPESAVTSADESALENISNIFGGGEVIE